MNEKVIINKRAAVIAWQLAMYHNTIAREMARLGKLARTDYPEAKKQLFRMFYGIVFQSAIDDDAAEVEDLIEMLNLVDEPPPPPPPPDEPPWIRVR